ncbi:MULTISPECIES: SDR family NAD(P)-dependent oxidoreductase [unclassified Streptomyces]|uniref:SDR family NAD(P)-dependent oxidoreductase n=1 Tax=unclassified Streptomyces TaxID=2593676 RepID=UPI00380F30EF
MTPSASRWSARDIPDQRGRVAVVTGADSGLGYVVARELARHGARVVLACRRARRGREAVARLVGEVPGADVETRRLDLGDLASVREFAAPIDRLDLLVNNAGGPARPYGTTADGFGTHRGVHHLGPFALTGLLLPTLLAAPPGARVVTVSSMVHLAGNLDLRALDGARGPRRRTAYGRSLSADLLFTHTLARRLRATGSDVVAAAAHPGRAPVGPVTRLLARSAEAGALPVLHAATAPDVAPDSFTGPSFARWRGGPAPARRAPWTRDDRAGDLLWAESARLTGVTYPELKGADPQG